jgi:hypothetical protein
MKNKCWLTKYFFIKTNAMKIGIAADHGGYELKEIIHPFLLSLGYEVNDFGAFE